jgi:hypothetical protein
MISIIISVLSGIVCALGYNTMDNATWGTYVFGVIGTIISFVLINRWKQKPLNAIIQGVQAKLQDAQEQVQKKANHFQSRPGGNQTAFMKTAEKIQAKATGEAIELLKDAEPFYKWNFLIEKQIDTMRFQLNYQIKNFEESDKYIDKIMLMDPSVVTMKMARLYKKDPLDREAVKDPAARKKILKDWSVSKVFHKGKGRMKGANGVLVYATYAWMLNKCGLAEEALSILLEGIKKSPDEVMTQNIDRLRNSKPKSFSNAKYGERWYALYLEEPPKQKQKMKRQSARNAGRPF